MDLNKFMQVNNLTLADMERITGISKITLNSYRNGTRTPKVDKAFQIEEATKGIVTAKSFVKIKKGNS